MKKVLGLTLIIILIPLVIVGIEHNEELIANFKYGFISNKIVKVKRTNTGKIEEVPLEKYVIGVVAGEMPASFNIEALKAQAVASRTYVLKRVNSNNNYDVEDNQNNQVYLDENQMHDKWKDDYDKNIKKINEAVNKTKGEVLLYDNKLIDAMFFSTSNGYTENSGDVFSYDVPYLVSVKSKWDEQESPVFSSSKEISKSEFLFNLGLDKTSSIDITNIEKTKTGRVKSITVNSKKIDAKKIRNIFGLKSTSFTINIKSDKVIFNVNGYGHGVGMSQYGANGMAKEGKNYKDILNYYYQNSFLKRIN